MHPIAKWEAIAEANKSFGRATISVRVRSAKRLIRTWI
jgi:hypothetical protein